MVEVHALQLTGAADSFIRSRGPLESRGSAVTDLLLVGAGHAHLYVVQRAAELAAAGYRVHMVAPRFFYYSGVASAAAAGALDSDSGRIDVRALVGVSGVEFHEGTLESLDPELRIATTSDGARLSYDVLSVNIGSVVAAGRHTCPSDRPEGEAFERSR